MSVAQIDPGCYSPLGLVKYLLNQPELIPYCKSSLRSISSFDSTLSMISAETRGHYFKVLATTCLLESPFYFWVQSRHSKGFRKLTHWILSTVFCNFCSHPAVYFLFPALAAYFEIRYVHMLAAAEVFAPIFEAWLLIRIWKIPPFKATIGMISANLFSWWVGIYWV